MVATVDAGSLPAQPASAALPSYIKPTGEKAILLPLNGVPSGAPMMVMIDVRSGSDGASLFKERYTEFAAPAADDARAAKITKTEVLAVEEDGVVAESEVGRSAEECMDRGGGEKGECVTGPESVGDRGREGKSSSAALREDQPTGARPFEVPTASWLLETVDDRPRVLSALARVLERIMQLGEDRSGKGALYSQLSFHKLTVFHGLRPPTISLSCYLERIHKYANCSPACFVAAFAYIDRILQRRNDSLLSVTTLNVHRLIITAVMVAAKFLDDSYFNNAYYAKVGGVSTQEMNRLEMDFLFRIDFSLAISTAEFETYAVHLSRDAGLLQRSPVFELSSEQISSALSEPQAPATPELSKPRQLFPCVDSCGVEAANNAGINGTTGQSMQRKLRPHEQVMHGLS